MSYSHALSADRLSTIGRSLIKPRKPAGRERFASHTSARILWFGEFADGALEASYMRDEVAESLPRRCTVMALFFCVIMMVYIPIEVFTSAHPNVESRVFMSVACVFWAALLVASRAAAHGRLATCSLEWLFALLYGVIAGLTMLGYGGVLGWLDDDSDKLAAQLLGDFWNIFLQQQCVLVLIVIVTPLRARTFGLLVGQFAVSVLIARMYLGMSCSTAHGCPDERWQWANRIVTIIEVSAFSALTCFVSITLNLIRRRAYDFYRSVEAAAAERAVRDREVADAEQAALREAAEQEKREAAAQAHVRLIRVVMHDLRSPLLAVVSSVERLKRAAHTVPTGDPSVQQTFSTLSVCSKMMENIISDMLDFERVASGRLVLVREAFHVAQLVDTAHCAFIDLAEARGITLATHVELPLLEQTLAGDARRLQQCVNSLVSNALKFTDRGGNVSISISPAGDGEWARTPPTASEPGAVELVHVSVKVVDDGVGLTAEEIERHHGSELFTQVGKGQLQGHGGAGLGLSITRQLLELHDGSELRLSSDGLGYGTTAELLLRLRRPDRSSSPLRRRRFAEDGLIRARQLREALLQLPSDFSLALVDDDDALRKSLPPRLFGPLPFQVFAGGEALLARVRDGGQPVPALIVIDSHMPRMSGAQCSRSLRKAGYAGKVIGLSGDPEGSPERRDFEAAGCNAVMRKDAKGLEAVAGLVHAFATQLASGEAEGDDEVTSVLTAASPAPSRADAPSSNPHEPSARAQGDAPQALTLPGAVLAPQPPPAESPEPAQQRPSLGRCLYAEDDPFLQLTMSEQLFGAIGVPYDLASNGLEALERVQSAAAPYDVVVLDNQMPKLTGTDVARQLRSDGCEALIIGLTGDPRGSEDREAFEAAGLDMCADKSSEGVSSIIALIQQALEARQPTPTRTRTGDSPFVIDIHHVVDDAEPKGGGRALSAHDDAGSTSAQHEDSSSSNVSTTAAVDDIEHGRAPTSALRSR